MECRSLGELTDITTAHAKRSYSLGFGAAAVVRNTLSKANKLRDPRIFEEYAFYMVSLAQQRRITKEFELHERFYAVDSTTIDLCMSVFRWARFRSTKSGIKIHTQIDIVTEIPVFYRITNANVHDSRAMEWIGLDMNPMLAKYSTVGISISPDFSPYTFVAHSSLSERKDILNTKSSVGMSLSTEKTMSCSTRQSALQEREIEKTILPNSEELSTTHQTLDGLSYTIPTTSILQPRTSHCFTATVGRWNSSSNGLSSIFKSTPFGARRRMLSEYKFTSLSSHIASSQSSGTTLRLVGRYSVLRVLGKSLLVKDSIQELFLRRPDDVFDDGQLKLNF